MGTIQLPYDVFLSAFYRHYSGAPWNRTASIRPPASWTTDNNAYRQYYTVNIEPLGSRRYKASDILDIRFEKGFELGEVGRISVYFDVFNIGGYYNVVVGENDVFRYNPSTENVSEPENVTLAGGYKAINAATGTRSIRFIVSDSVFKITHKEKT